MADSCPKEALARLDFAGGENRLRASAAIKSSVLRPIIFECFSSEATGYVGRTLAS